MATEISKRPRSASGDANHSNPLNIPSSKLPKTSHTEKTFPLLSPPLPSSSHAQIDYLSRRTSDNLPLITAEDPLPVIFRLLNNYESVLQRQESIAGYLGACTLGPMLAKRFERLFDAPPKVLKSQEGDGTTISWLDVVEFAKNHPDQFTLEKMRDGVHVCHVYTKQCRVEISEEDYRLIKSGMPQRMIPPQPILEDEEQEVNMLELLERKLGQIMQLADQVSVRARHLSQHLRNRANAINARRRSDVNLQSHMRQQHQQFQQLQQCDPAAAGRLASRGPWPGSITTASSEPQPSRVEPVMAPSITTGRDHIPGTDRQLLFEDPLRNGGTPSIARGGAVQAVDVGRLDRHLEDILSATSFLHSSSVPDNVTVINGASVKNASPSTRTEMMRKFLNSNEQTADRVDGATNLGHVNHTAEDIPRPYIPPLPKTTTAHGGDELLHLRGYPTQPTHPLSQYHYNHHPPHQSPHQTHPRAAEADSAKANPDYSILPSSNVPVTGPSPHNANGIIPNKPIPTPFLQQPGPTNARGTTSKSPSRSGQQAGRSSGQSNGHRTTRDDGGPFKSEMIARMDELARGDRIMPPCDRCRRLQIECRKNLTACKGCTKKHAKCSWKDVKIEELQNTRPRAGSQTMPTTESGAGLVRVTSLEDQQSSVLPNRPSKTEKRKRASSSAKSPSNPMSTGLQSGETLPQQAMQESDADAQPTQPKSSSSPPQHPQPSDADNTQGAASRVPRASSITVGALGIHTTHAFDTVAQDTLATSPVARPHSVEANVGFPSLPGYREIIGSPPSAPSKVPGSFPSKGLPDQLPPLVMPVPEQREQQLEQQQYTEHTPAQPYLPGRHRSSFSRFQFQSPEQESRKDDKKDNEDSLHHQYGSPKNRPPSQEISRRPENDPLSIAAISDTVAQHMAARAAAETNATRSASGRPDSASAASASPRCSERMAMTPNSAVTCSGSALSAPTCTALDKLSSTGVIALKAPPTGPLLSPSSGPVESKRPLSPIDVVISDSARYKWASEQRETDGKENHWRGDGDTEMREAEA